MGQTDRQTHRHTDIATDRLNWPKGRFSENRYLLIPQFLQKFTVRRPRDKGPTVHNHGHEPPLLQLLPELGEVHLGPHVAGQDGEVGPQVLLHVAGPVVGVSGRVDDAPDVQGRVAEGEGLEVQDLDFLGGAWEKGVLWGAS